MTAFLLTFAALFLALGVPFLRALDNSRTTR